MSKRQTINYQALKIFGAMYDQRVNCEDVAMVVCPIDMKQMIAQEPQIFAKEKRFIPGHMIS
jgi:hypothetical protein